MLRCRHMTKFEYIDRINHLNARTLQKPSDYAKGNVKKHNKAMQSLIALEDKLKDDLVLAGEVYLELLESTNKLTQSNAAVRCLQLGIHTERALEILEYRRVNGEPWEKMGAERQLKLWRGEIKPHEPG